MMGMRNIYQVISLLLFLIIALYFPVKSEARITPEDIVNSKREAYEKRVINYSFLHQQQLKSLAEKIAQVNKKRTDELDRAMIIQAAVLDEYERRQPGKNTEVIKNARYWVTYAHEAVAYQAAKIYIFELTSEGNLKNDALNTISLFQSELNSTRLKVIRSQQILKGLVKDQ